MRRMFTKMLSENNVGSCLFFLSLTFVLHFLAIVYCKQNERKQFSTSEAVAVRDTKIGIALLKWTIHAVCLHRCFDFDLLRIGIKSSAWYSECLRSHTVTTRSFVLNAIWCECKITAKHNNKSTFSFHPWIFCRSLNWKIFRCIRRNATWKCQKIWEKHQIWLDQTIFFESIFKKLLVCFLKCWECVLFGLWNWTFTWTVNGRRKTFNFVYWKFKNETSRFFWVLFLAFKLNIVKWKYNLKTNDLSIDF